MKYFKPVIIIRKKIEGENSIEELVNAMKNNIDVDIISCPFASTSIKGILGNIEFIRKIKAPVYHIMTPTEAYLLPFLKDGKRIITYHDLNTLYKSRNRIYQILRVIMGIVPSKLFADVITFVSSQTKEEFVKKMFIKNESKLYVIYNAYDTRLAPKDKNENGIFTVLQIGTGLRKNLISTIKAIKQLPVRLNIIGKLNTEQEQLLNEYNISYTNKFDIDYEEIVNEYANCDIVCFPTFYEGFGLPIIEANVMKRPIISSDIPIIHEIGGNAVYYIDPNDVSTIRNAIMDLKNNYNKREMLIKNGLINSRRFMPSEIYSQYERIYNDK